MANETLQQLKIKPLPKAQEQFNIILNIPKEGVAPHIIDKTSEKLINRDQFFSTIQEYLEVVQKGYKKISKMANSKGEEVVDAIKDAIKEFGALGVFHKLDAIAKLSRRTVPEAAEAFRKDRDWLKSHYKLKAF